MGLMCRLPHKTTEAGKIRCQDTFSLGSDNLQGLVDIIAEKVKNELIGRSDVIDHLLSEAKDLPLSAKQGQVLDNKIYFKTNNNPPYHIDDPGLPPGLYAYGYDNGEITGTKPPFNYGYIVNIKADSSLLFQIAFQYFAKGLYVRNYYSQNGNYTWSEWEGMITESDPDYIALKQEVENLKAVSQKRYDISISGSDQMFYPLVINVDQFDLERIKILSKWGEELRKTKAMWYVSGDGWFTTTKVYKLKLYKIGTGGEMSKIVSKTAGLTGAAAGWFIVWLRGNYAYSVVTDNMKSIEEPKVYYERTNLRPGNEYPYYVEPTDRIEDDAYNSDVDNL